MHHKEIEAKIEKLPKRILPELLDYIDFLLQKHGSQEEEEIETERGFSFDWEGGLSRLKAAYTSVGLQHKALDWR